MCKLHGMENTESIRLFYHLTRRKIPAEIIVTGYMKKLGKARLTACYERELISSIEIWKYCC